MAEIGKINKLEVVRKQEFGLYLDGGRHGEILLPRNSVPEGCSIGDIVEVFIYFDSEDRIIATTTMPKVMVDQFAVLKAVAVNNVGAFLDWGLTKDLFVPFNEQIKKMVPYKKYVVFVYYDVKSNRIAASAKLQKFQPIVDIEYQEEEKVDLIICNSTDLGYNAIVNNQHWGMLYENEVFQKLSYADEITGYIKKVRPDGKIDLILDKPGPKKIDKLSQSILDKLKENNGFLKITDKSPPEEISKLFGVSKKTYKKAIGALYKRKHIVLEKDGIRLL